MEHNAKNICRPVISGKEQNLNKKWLNLEFQYYMNILAKFNTFKVLKINFAIQ